MPDRSPSAPSAPVTLADFFTEICGVPAPGERLELRAFPLAGPSARRFCADIAVAVQAVRAISFGRNTYFGVGRRRGNRGRKADTIQVQAAWADVDFKVYADGEAGARAALQRFGLRPSVVVASGGGYQAYWLLNAPVLPEAFARLEAVNRGLARTLGPPERALDMAVDASRVLRVPGTHNYKYDPPAPTRLAAFHPERRYELADLEELVLPIAGQPYGQGPGQGHQRSTERTATTSILAGVPEGQRDILLFKLACRLRWADVPRGAAERLVLEAAAACQPPFPTDAALSKVDQAWRYPAGAGTPRQASPPTGAVSVAASAEALADLTAAFWKD